MEVFLQSDMQIIIKKVCSEAFLCIWRVGYHAALVEGCQFSVGLNGKYACKRVSASWAEGCMEWKKAPAAAGAFSGRSVGIRCILILFLNKII